MRKPIIAGNWKMNKTPQEAVAFIKDLNEKTLDHNVEVVVCAPYLCLESMKKEAKDQIKVYSENVHYETSGAYTGEISTQMLASIGITGTIIGHSERRKYFNETDEVVSQKVKKCIEDSFFSIVCVGELLEEREANEHQAVVAKQVEGALVGVEEKDLQTLCIAYEPVWAIGTGKTASDEDAQAMCKFIRSEVEKLYSKDAADQLRILYGGSVKPSNVKGLMSQEDIDGALVGGASLEVDSFTELVNFKG